MLFERDWFMRQIEMFVQFVARLIFDRDTIQYEIQDPAHLTQTDLLYERLTALVAEGKVCEAEDLLFAHLNDHDMAHLALAVDFYQTLNRLNDNVLEACNFSREEIYDGLKEILDRFGIPEYGV